MWPYPPAHPADATLPFAVARTGSPIAARKSRPVCMAGRPRKGSVRIPKPDVNSTSPITGFRYGTSARVRLRRSIWARVMLILVKLTLERAGVGVRLTGT